MPEQSTANAAANKDEILRAIATLSQSGVRSSVEQIQGREALLTQLVELTTEFRATTDHLKRLNGSVARYEQEVQVLKMRAAVRDAACQPIARHPCGRRL